MTSTLSKNAASKSSAAKTSVGPAPRRYLALWFPFLPTDRVRRTSITPTSAEQPAAAPATPDERPLVIVAKIKSALRIVAVDQHATQLGLTAGTTLADARARITDLVSVEADTRADSRFLDHLAQMCGRFTPLVALDPADGLLLDITGCAHLFGGETGLRTKAATRLARLNLSVRACIAGTPDAARALARFSRVSIVPPGEDASLAQRLPVAAVAGLPAETMLALSRAGLKTIGDLAERPAQVLAARFGQDLITRLARIQGLEDTRITPLRPLPAMTVERHFAEPMTQTAAIEDLLAALIAEAAHILTERGQGGRIFDARFFRSDGVVRELRVQTGRPSRDVAAIMRLYRERLACLADPLDPGFGFDAFRLSVPHTEPLNTAQLQLDRADVTGSDGVGDLVDRLVARFGDSRVLRYEPRDSHDPDHAARLVPAAQANLPRELGTSSALANAWPALEPGEPPARPIHVFVSPHPIEALAEVPEGPPLRFRWRRVLHEIACAEGPERIAPAWWRTPGEQPARSYYRVEDTNGCRFWIFREGLYGESTTPPRWYLYGLFV